MVTFISQCEKKALTRTRRVLDAFANRIGDRTWQTPMTQEGLSAAKKLLRRTASKNTAVACHWLRGTRHSDLLWVVGNRERFDRAGNVPVNTTRSNRLHHEWENDWHYLPLIKVLTALAALFHDWGKASVLFQDKLDPNKKSSSKGDPLRHEWVSCLLLRAFVCAGDSGDTSQPNDADWLARLARGEIDEAYLQRAVQTNTAKPLADLPPIASLVAWLVLTHHRLPTLPRKKARPNWNNRSTLLCANDWMAESAEKLADTLKFISQEWGYENFREKERPIFKQHLSQCFTFPQGLLSRSTPWLKPLKKWAKRAQDHLLSVEKALATGSERLLLHHARLALMLGDHQYSSQAASKQWSTSVELYANTDRKTKRYKQKLDEHLTGVAGSALKIAHLLPRLEKQPPRVDGVSALKKRSPPAFRWQDRAVEKIRTWKKPNDASGQVSGSGQPQGFFAVNMASTGCGKTFANAKIMRALSDDGDSLRYVLALGLRTLTLQTGDEYRQRIGLDNSELAVQIGSKAVLELHQQKQDTEQTHDEQDGSESQESLLDEDVDYEGALPEEELATVLKTERDRKFLYAPVLTCTIDHLMAATETIRGGRYILPSLRLMSSDLVIDEVDDFDGNDLIAIGRLIHLAGMLGRKVMISSATIPPALAEGYFNTYREGWQLHCKTRDASAVVGCAWIDEFSTRVECITESSSQQALARYQDHHQFFIDKRVAKLKAQPVRRKGEIITCDALHNTDEPADDTEKSQQQRYFEVIQQAILAKHSDHHIVDECTQKTVSFGVVRMANIEPCIALAEYLMKADWPEDTDAKMMVYHSRQVLLLRHAQEEYLDAVLRRKEEPGTTPAALSNPVIRAHLEEGDARKQLFILVATPVEEVGRDHDFDWAVVEPSSFRSIIQLAGRVMRHRDTVIDTSNIALMQYNLKALQNGADKQAYCRPGYESSRHPLHTHDLQTLLAASDIAPSITAIPRIQRPKQANPTHRLADLEHTVTDDLLGADQGNGPKILSGWLSQYWWLTGLAQTLTPFREGVPDIKLHLIWEDGELCFKKWDQQERSWANRENLDGIQRQRPGNVSGHRCWLQRDYAQRLKAVAEDRNISMRKASEKYGELCFPDYDNGLGRYVYSDQWGLRKADD